MSKKEIFFFATKMDLRFCLEEISNKLSLKYILNDVYNSTEEVNVYNNMHDLDNFGINTSGDHQSESYLVMYQNDSLNIEEVKQTTGGFKYFVSQKLNKDSIDFWPGGLYESSYLICGHVGTISSEPRSIQLYKDFTKEITKRFKKVRGFYIGNNVFEIKDNVRLITMNIKQPIEYDFKL